MLPYEEFLSRALADEDSDIEDENDHSMSNSKNLIEISGTKDSKEIIISDED